ncbi:hypothetical protein FNW25_07735 [Flavobacterium franklandianum]|uniref:Uncharacterized protein n=1 Tax=Flavobacterium franklandianum TaxID=2594430 RepID=A0A553CJV9_9FLAO|nr:hypothetical protein [Flavobacterium franklandianum]TRX20760.1 hypothetical protein FNW17_10295 [Flavobacterium franklandianum]TRX26771.1 hypothetical protein FNW25_07735 [Flavobacterium franklandianum]
MEILFLRKAIFSWCCRTTPDASGEVPARPWKKDFIKKDCNEQLEIAPDFSYRQNDNYDFFKYIYIMIRKIK